MRRGLRRGLEAGLRRRRRLMPWKNPRTRSGTRRIAFPRPWRRAGEGCRTAALVAPPSARPGGGLDVPTAGPDKPRAPRAAMELARLPAVFLMLHLEA